jgi:hypothetical protein
MSMTMTGLLFGPWVAVAALFRKIEHAMRSQAMSFELERSELERKALDSRLRLLQAVIGASLERRYRDHPWEDVGLQQRD